MYGFESRWFYPDQRRLVLPDDWPDDLYPLRKDSMDYRLRPDPQPRQKHTEFINEKAKHVLFHLARYISLRMNQDISVYSWMGKISLMRTIVCSILHRGMEKLAETRMDYDQVNFLADRVCGICGFTHGVAYANSVESALGIQIPKRAEWIRCDFVRSRTFTQSLIKLRSI